MEQPTRPPDQAARRAEEDAAAVVTVLAVLAVSTDDQDSALEPTNVWGDPAHVLGVDQPSAAGWWASGLPR